MKPAMLFRLARPAILSTVAVLSCNDLCGCTPVIPSPILGVWSATQFLVTPTGQTQIDILAEGGSLTITIDYGNSTVGAMSVPATVSGVGPLMASMAGTAIINTAETEVTFFQAAETFVRDLTWQRVGTTTLRVSNQVAGSAEFTVTLTKQ